MRQRQRRPYAIPLAKATTSAGVTVTLTLAGLSPPLAKRSGRPTARPPADAFACVVSACLPFERPSPLIPKPFFLGSSFFSSGAAFADPPATPLLPSVTVAIAAIGLASNV